MMDNVNAEIKVDNGNIIKSHTFMMSEGDKQATYSIQVSDKTALKVKFILKNERKKKGQEEPGFKISMQTMEKSKTIKITLHNIKKSVSPLIVIDDVPLFKIGNDILIMKSFVETFDGAMNNVTINLVCKK